LGLYNKVFFNQLIIIVWQKGKREAGKNSKEKGKANKKKNTKERKKDRTDKRNREADREIKRKIPNRRPACLFTESNLILLFNLQKQFKPLR